MIHGITFTNQQITAANFAHFMHIWANGASGVTKGCVPSVSGINLNITAGYFMVYGRFVQLIGTEVVAAPELISGSVYCRLVFEIDLTKTNTEETFNQGVFKVIYNETAYPELTQEDLDDAGTKYQISFAKFITSSTEITDFVVEAEQFDIENSFAAVTENLDTYDAEFMEYFNAQKLIIEGMIADLQDEDFVTREELRTVYNATITTTWTADSTNGGYTQNIAVNGITANDKPIVDLICSNVLETAESETADWAKIFKITTGANSITVRATEETEVALNIQIKEVG